MPADRRPAVGTPVGDRRGRRRRRAGGRASRAPWACACQRCPSAWRPCAQWKFRSCSRAPTSPAAPSNSGAYQEIPPALLAGADLVLDGGELPGIASTVLDLRDVRIPRPLAYCARGAGRAGGGAEGARVRSLGRIRAAQRRRTRTRSGA